MSLEDVPHSPARRTVAELSSLRAKVPNFVDETLSV